MAATSSLRAYRGRSGEDRRSERRERMLEAGLRLFGTRGFLHTKVRDVCAEARLTERYLYESFRSLEELMVAVFDRVAGEVVERVAAAVAAAPRNPRDVERAAMAAAIEHVTGDPRRARIMFLEARGSIPELERRRVRVVREYARLVETTQRDLLGDAAPTPTDARMTSIAIMAAVGELIMAWHTGDLEISRERLIDHASELMHAVALVSSEPRDAAPPPSKSPRRKR
jgi:AcrR family transcriptional regulator